MRYLQVNHMDITIESWNRRTMVLDCGSHPYYWPLSEPFSNTKFSIPLKELRALTSDI